MNILKYNEFLLNENNVGAQSTRGIRVGSGSLTKVGVDNPFEGLEVKFYIRLKPEEILKIQNNPRRSNMITLGNLDVYFWPNDNDIKKMTKEKLMVCAKKLGMPAKGMKSKETEEILNYVINNKWKSTGSIKDLSKKFELIGTEDANKVNANIKIYRPGSITETGNDEIIGNFIRTDKKWEFIPKK